MLRSWADLFSRIEVLDRPVGHQDLEGGDPAALLHGQQLLVDDGLQRGGKLNPDLLLLLAGEDVDDPVDRLGGVVGVEGGEDQVAGLGDGQGDPDRLQVAHLTDQQHVRVLAEAAAQRLGEARACPARARAARPRSGG